MSQIITIANFFNRVNSICNNLNILKKNTIKKAHIFKFRGTIINFRLKKLKIVRFEKKTCCLRINDFYQRVILILVFYPFFLFVLFHVNLFTA